VKKDEESFWGHLWREALTAISLGWNLAIPIFGGVLLGYLLDRRLGTGHIFTMGLLALGVGIGYYNLARFIRRVHRRDQQQMNREDEEMRDR
jgi:F0F1-type ATP synthase assembly protein I